MSVVYRDLTIDCTKDNFKHEKVTGYEHGVKVFRFKILNENIPIDLTDCTGAAYVGTKSDGKIIGNACEIKDNKILLPLSLQMTTARGELKGHIEIYFPTGTLKFYGVNFEVFPSPETAEIESTDEFTLLESAIAEVNKIIAEGIETSQGKSAYEIAVENGFAGTVDEWLESLKGEKGEDGKDGKNGIDGIDGQNGADGRGITNTEINASGELVLTYSDGSTANVGVIVGAKGEKGDKGDTGATGTDGNDYVLTEADKTEIAQLSTNLKGYTTKLVAEVTIPDDYNAINVDICDLPESNKYIVYIDNSTNGVDNIQPRVGYIDSAGWLYLQNSSVSNALYYGYYIEYYKNITMPQNPDLSAHFIEVSAYNTHQRQPVNTSLSTVNIGDKPAIRVIMSDWSILPAGMVIKIYTV